MMKKCTRGISIAETLIGIFLLALILTVLFNLFPTTVLANRKGTKQLEASNLAQSTLSELRARPFDSLTVGLNESLPEHLAGGNRYQVSFKVLGPEFGDPDNLKVLEVKVEWTSNNQEQILTEKVWVHKVMEDT